MILGGTVWIGRMGWRVLHCVVEEVVAVIYMYVLILL
jgi:hypothetical protein